VPAHGTVAGEGQNPSEGPQEHGPGSRWQGGDPSLHWDPAPGQQARAGGKCVGETCALYTGRARCGHTALQNTNLVKPPFLPPRSAFPSQRLSKPTASSASGCSAPSSPHPQHQLCLCPALEHQPRARARRNRRPEEGSAVTDLPVGRGRESNYPSKRSNNRHGPAELNQHRDPIHRSARKHLSLGQFVPRASSVLAFPQKR